jgi:hypothetical protein
MPETDTATMRTNHRSVNRSQRQRRARLRGQDVRQESSHLGVIGMVHEAGPVRPVKRMKRGQRAREWRTVTGTGTRHVD